jgi:NDP-sugar pyrophosphorylase family protein
MKAMILAAGYGTRLRPITNDKPKALVAIDGIPLLQLIIHKLIATGVDEIIINVHHHADQIQAFLRNNRNFGIQIELSHEPEILGTGGGLKKASHFFNNDQPFFLHNVDILSTINLSQMYQYHLNHAAMATLAIQPRYTSRGFIVDEQDYICGHEDRDNQRTRLKRNPQGNSRSMAFCGIHIISPAIFQYIDETGRFSIIDVYLKLIEKGLPIIGYTADQFYWQDIGKLNTLNEINKGLTDGIIQLDWFTK